MPNDDPPRLHTNSQTLSLSFSSTLIQSSMRLAAPDELVLDYTRAMMGFLLLQPAPRHLLMIGLGGGSMLKYLHRHLPATAFTVVEISPAVIDLRNDFLVPPDGPRLRTVCDDGARFLRDRLRQPSERTDPSTAPEPPEPPDPPFDVILVDGFDGAGLPAALSTRRFYEDCRAALSDDGVLVANVQADTARTQEVRQRLGRAFGSKGGKGGGKLACVESDEGGNEVMLVTSSDAQARGSADFEARWAALAPEHQATLAATSTRWQRALRKGLQLG